MHCHLKGARRRAVLIMASFLMLLVPACVLAQATEDEASDTGGTDTAAEVFEEAVDTNDPTAAAWAYALGMEFYDWKTDTLDNGQTRPTGNDNTLQFRVVAPLQKGTLGLPLGSLVRFTYKNLEAPGGTSGSGNAELMWLLLPVDWGTGRWGIGPVVNFPADEKQFGTDAWRFGIGTVVIQNSFEGKMLWGVLAQQVWGETKSNSDSVFASPIAIQPFAVWSFNERWYISNGESPWAFNWQAKEWLIPFGVRVGRLFKTAGGTWNAYAEYRTPLVYKDWPGAVAENTVRVQVSFTPSP